MRFVVKTLFRVICLVLLTPLSLQADDSTAQTVADVNKKMVKLFGSGGFKGLASYGTGLLVSPRGHILTVATPMLDTQDLRVHLYDGRRLHAKVLVVEPVLDAALVKIDDDKLDDLPYFDIAQAAARPLAQMGDAILGFSNQFQIATRDEPMPPFVEDVLAESPAAKAGLKPDDLIVYVDGEQVISIRAFKEIIDRTRPGTALKLEVRRDDKAVAGSGTRLMTVELKLEEPK